MNNANRVPVPRSSIDPESEWKHPKGWDGVKPPPIQVNWSSWYSQVTALTPTINDVAIETSKFPHLLHSARPSHHRKQLASTCGPLEVLRSNDWGHLLTNTHMLTLGIHGTVHISNFYTASMKRNLQKAGLSQPFESDGPRTDPNTFWNDLPRHIPNVSKTHTCVWGLHFLRLLSTMMR